MYTKWPCRRRGAAAWLFRCCVLLLYPLCQAQCPIAEEAIRNQCRCEQIDSRMVIYCKGMGLTQMPTFTTSSLQWDEVTLADNNIASIPAGHIAPLHLAKLDLSGNPITSIVDGAFSGFIEQELRDLILEVAQMVNFPKQALSVLQKLETLYLGGFQLSGLPNGALETLTNLRILSLTDCGLSTLKSSALSGQTERLEQLFLDFNEFSGIPTEALSALKALSLLSVKHNILNSIPNGAFQGAGALKILDLSNNGFSNINPTAFSGLEDTLENLTMRSCQLRDQDLPPMSGLTSLRELDLGHNSIANIPVDYFKNIPALESLTLTGNQLASLQVSSFRGLDNLRDLDIGENGIAAADSGFFDVLPRLKRLLANDNPAFMSALPSGGLDSVATTLDTLILINTGFDSTDWPKVQSLARLQLLALSQNQIQTLPDFVLQEMSGLTSLFLSDNQLVEVTQRGLRGVQNSLVSADFSNNQLTTLSQCALAEFTQFAIYGLGLGENPLHCDCGVQWLLEALQQDPQYNFKKYAIDWTCATPAALSGKKIWEVGLEQFGCGGNPATSPPCEQFTTTPASPSTDIPSSFRTNVTATSPTTITVTWSISAEAAVGGFRVEWHEAGNVDDSHYAEYAPEARAATITGLETGTPYTVCVEALLHASSQRTTNPLVCDEATTEPDPGAVGGGDGDDKTLQIALGCAFGALALALIIGLVVFGVRKHSKKANKSSGLPQTRQDMPHLGYESKRFSKPKRKPSRGAADLAQAMASQNHDNQGFENKMENSLSKEEQNRILRMYGVSGGSTLSVVSSASAMRYVPELPPRPVELVKYRNDDDPDKHVYCEIPDGNYAEIPASQA